LYSLRLRGSAAFKPPSAPLRRRQKGLTNIKEHDLLQRSVLLRDLLSEASSSDGRCLPGLLQILGAAAAVLFLFVAAVGAVAQGAAQARQKV